MADNNRKYALRFTNEDFPLCVPHPVLDHTGYRQVVYCELTPEQFRELRSEHHINHHQYVRVEDTDLGSGRDVMVHELLADQNQSLLVKVIQSMFKTIGGAPPAEERLRANARTLEELHPEAARCLLTLCENFHDPLTECADDDIWDMVDNYGLEIWDFYHMPVGVGAFPVISAERPDWPMFSDMMDNGVRAFQRRCDPAEAKSLGIPNSPLHQFRSQVNPPGDESNGDLPALRRAVVLVNDRGMAAAVQLEDGGEVKAASIFGGSDTLTQEARAALV